MISEQFIDEYDEIPDPRNRLDDLIEDLQKLSSKPMMRWKWMVIFANCTPETCTMTRKKYEIERTA